MRVMLDVMNKDAVLVKKDGTEVSRYSFKNLIGKDFTFEELKKDIDSFNAETLSKRNEFDDIKELGECVKQHNW